MLENIFYFIILTLLLGFFGMMVYIYIHLISALFVWPPTIPTDRKTKKIMLEAAKRYFPAEAEIKIADLGCGYGGFVRPFTSYFKNAKYTGYDILKVPHLFTKYLFRKNPNINFIHQNFLNADLSGYDLVVMFYKEMKKDRRLIEMLKKNTTKEVIVISNNFELYDINYLEKITVNDFVTGRYVYVYKF
jgi:SAM-dependent methyltransferase